MTSALESPITTPTAPERSGLPGWIRALLPVAGLVVVLGFFSLVLWLTGKPPILTLYNLQIIGQETAVVGMAALGMTLVIITAGIDLSVGSVISLVSVVIAVQLKGHTTPMLALAAGLAVAAACGLLNGGLITAIKLPPFIVTLATLVIFRGLTEETTHSQAVYPAHTWLNDLLNVPQGAHAWMLVAPGIWLLILMALLVEGMLRFTRFGRHVFAVGSNQQTARLCGVNVKRVKLATYTLGALFAGFAGVLQFAYGNGGDPTSAAGYELNVIAAVVIGGASLNGGEGTILGSLVGALLMTVIDIGCSKMGMNTSREKIVTGLVILIAVSLDRLQHRRK